MFHFNLGRLTDLEAGPIPTHLRPETPGASLPLSFFNGREEATRVIKMSLWVTGYEEEEDRKQKRTGSSAFVGVDEMDPTETSEDKGKKRDTMLEEPSTLPLPREGEEGWWPKRIVFESTLR